MALSDKHVDSDIVQNTIQGTLHTLAHSLSEFKTKYKCMFCFTYWKSEGTSPTVLMYTSLNITTNELCERLLDYPVTENMMCAIDNRGGTNRDACQVRDV